MITVNQLMQHLKRANDTHPNWIVKFSDEKGQKHFIASVDFDHDPKISNVYLQEPVPDEDVETN
jgi:hypothetical protein